MISLTARPPEAVLLRKTADVFFNSQSRRTLGAFRRHGSVPLTHLRVQQHRSGSQPHRDGHGRRLPRAPGSPRPGARPPPGAARGAAPCPGRPHGRAAAQGRSREGSRASPSPFLLFHLLFLFFNLLLPGRRPSHRASPAGSLGRFAPAAPGTRGPRPVPQGPPAAKHPPAPRPPRGPAAGSPQRAPGTRRRPSRPPPPAAPRGSPPGPGSPQRPQGAGRRRAPARGGRRQTPPSGTPHREASAGAAPRRHGQG